MGFFVLRMICDFLGFAIPFDSYRLAFERSRDQDVRGMAVRFLVWRMDGMKGKPGAGVVRVSRDAFLSKCDAVMSGWILKL